MAFSEKLLDLQNNTTKIIVNGLNEKNSRKYWYTIICKTG